MLSKTSLRPCYPQIYLPSPSWRKVVLTLGETMYDRTIELYPLGLSMYCNRFVPSCSTAWNLTGKRHDEWRDTERQWFRKAFQALPWKAQRLLLQVLQKEKKQLAREEQVPLGTLYGRYRRILGALKRTCLRVGGRRSDVNYSSGAGPIHQPFGWFPFPFREGQKNQAFIQSSEENTPASSFNICRRVFYLTKKNHQLIFQN